MSDRSFESPTIVFLAVSLVLQQQSRKKTTGACIASPHAARLESFTGLRLREALVIVWAPRCRFSGGSAGAPHPENCFFDAATRIFARFGQDDDLLQYPDDGYGHPTTYHPWRWPGWGCSLWKRGLLLEWVLLFGETKGQPPLLNVLSTRTVARLIP